MRGRVKDREVSPGERKSPKYRESLNCTAPEFWGKKIGVKGNLRNTNQERENGFYGKAGREGDSSCLDYCSKSVPFNRQKGNPLPDISGKQRSNSDWPHI